MKLSQVPSLKRDLFPLDSYELILTSINPLGVNLSESKDSQTLGLPHEFITPLHIKGEERQYEALHA